MPTLWEPSLWRIAGRETWRFMQSNILVALFVGIVGTVAVVLVLRPSLEDSFLENAVMGIELLLVGGLVSGAAAFLFFFLISPMKAIKRLDSLKKTAPDESDRAIAYLEAERITSVEGRQLDLSNAFLLMREELLGHPLRGQSEKRATGILQIGSIDSGEIKRMYGHFHTIGVTIEDERELAPPTGGSLTGLKLSALGGTVLQRLANRQPTADIPGSPT